MHPLIKRTVSKSPSDMYQVEIDTNLFKNAFIINSVSYENADKFKELNELLENIIDNPFLVLLVHEWHNKEIGIRLTNDIHWPNSIIHLTEVQEKIILKMQPSLIEFNKDCKFVVIFSNQEDLILAKLTNCFNFSSIIS